MKLWRCVLIFAVSITELMLAQHDDDFDDIDNEEFDDVPQKHYHYHDDDGSFEARKSLEHVNFIIFNSVNFMASVCSILRHGIHPGTI